MPRSSPRCPALAAAAGRRRLVFLPGPAFPGRGGLPLPPCPASIRVHVDGACGAVLLVASARGLEGRTSVAANLATALAYAGDKVILVDADLQRPSLSRVFGTGHRPGLGDLLAGRASLEEAAVPTDVPGLRLVTAGRGGRPGRRTCWRLPACSRSFARMKAVADVIVVDSAPVLEVSDALTLARVSELVVVVADLRRTRRGDASSAAQQIRAVGAGDHRRSSQRDATEQVAVEQEA